MENYRPDNGGFGKSSATSNTRSISGLRQLWQSSDPQFFCVLVISYASGVEPLPQRKARDQPAHVKLIETVTALVRCFSLGFKHFSRTGKKDTSLETGGVLLFSDIRRRRKTEARKTENPANRRSVAIMSIVKSDQSFGIALHTKMTLACMNSIERGFSKSSW